MHIRRRPPNPSVSVASLQYQVKMADAQPQNILEEIVWQKETEVAQWRERMPLNELQFHAKNALPTRDFLAALRQSKNKPAVIAEVKKASPSKGVIREDFEPISIAKAYEKGGASCVSVLTDSKFFQGSFQYLTEVRQAIGLPVLCKDFIIYPYQIYRARVHGADAALLIAAILPDRDIQYFVKIIKALGMTALVEVHNLEELDRVLAIEGIDLIGINNRNLEDFSVDVQTTVNLMDQRGKQLQEKQILVVSESGLFTRDDLQVVADVGASAVLIGESLMKQVDPATALSQLTCSGTGAD